MEKQDVHLFALYYERVHFMVHHAQTLDLHDIVDQEIVHRLYSILRIKQDQMIILFDSHHNIHCSILAIDAKKITVQLHQLAPNKQLEPRITWVLPLLKKEAFEEAIYTLTEMGVQEIQPIVTQKTYRFVQPERDSNRIKKIMIAAAEQSKQFILPTVLPIYPLDVWLEKDTGYSKKIFFDANGSKLIDVIKAIEIERMHHLYAFVGPEGDLTESEKQQLAAQGFSFCRLTPTVLRAQQAITVALGAIRSLM